MEWNHFYKNKLFLCGSQVSSALLLVSMMPFGRVYVLIVKKFVS
jgi:hypothetical protein